MIEINLLPEDLRKKKKAFEMPKIGFFAPIAIGIAFLLILSHVGFILAVNMQKHAYKRMRSEWEGLKPEKSSVELAKKENLKMQRDEDLIKALMEEKVLWWRKLNQLSDLVIPGLWFTKISLEDKSITAKAEGVKPAKSKRGSKKAAVKKIIVPCLKIEGAVSPAYGDELAIIGKFIERLKSAPDFFKDFSKVELGSTRLHSIKDTEVMLFNIDCYFTAEGNPSL